MGCSDETYTVHDAANQLVRENLYYGANDPNNATYTYEYDEWGNLLRKLEYAYTTAAELAEPIINVALSFNGNPPATGGAVANLPSSINAAPGTTVTIPNVTPQFNSGSYICEFDSWNTKANGMGTTYLPGQSITLNSNVTLYARWTVGFVPPGGDIRGEAPEKPNEPERSVAPYPVKAYIYKYADSNWKDKLTSIETHIVDSSGNMAQETVMNLTYDAMGNPTNYLGANLTWRGKQLTGYSKTGTSVTYAYNEDGLRTQKTHNGTITDYYYNGSVLIGMQSGNITQRFSYDAQGKVVSVDYSENGGSSYTTYYYLRNAQGDIVKLIDGSGNTVVEYTYDSWGKILAVTGSLATTLGENQPFRYRGYVYDSDTNLYYLQSRYYNPSLGRFISSDVYLSTGQGVLGHNSYAYCGNNPIIRSDTFGNSWFSDAWDWVVGAAETVGTWAADTFGFTYVIELDEVETTTESFIFETSVGIASSIALVESTKPINLAVKKTSLGFDGWFDYQLGFDINIAGAGISFSMGLATGSLELMYKNSSVELSTEPLKTSLTVYEIDDKPLVQTKAYTRYSINNIKTGFVAVAVCAVVVSYGALAPAVAPLIYNMAT